MEKELYKSLVAQTGESARYDSTSQTATPALLANTAPRTGREEGNPPTEPSSPSFLAKPSKSHLEDGNDEERQVILQDVKLREDLTAEARACYAEENVDGDTSPETLDIELSPEEEDLNSYYIYQYRTIGDAMALNFPPILPIIYHDVEGDVPRHKRTAVNLAFFGLVLQLALLFANLLVKVLNIIIVWGHAADPTSGSSTTAWSFTTASDAIAVFLGIIYIAATLLGATFFGLYWPVLNAGRTSNSLRYLQGIAALGISSALSLLMSLGVPFLSTGWIGAAILIFEKTPSIVVILLHFLLSAIWILSAVVFVAAALILTRAMKREDRSLQRGFQQLKQISKIHGKKSLAERLQWNFLVQKRG